jgi:hypothetical protein
MLPKIVVAFDNGNLLADIPAVDGYGGLVGTVSTPSLLGVPMIVNNLADAATKGFTQAAEPVMYRHLSEFYTEVGGNQQLYVMGVPNTEALADMVDDTNAAGAKALVAFANGNIVVLGVIKSPATGYNPGTDFMDADVGNAVIKANTFISSRITELRFLQILIEGRVAVQTGQTIYAPNTADNNFTGVVLGGSQPDGSASVGTALGRRIKYGAHIKIGKVANGPLGLTNCYIGNTPITQLANLEALHDAGYISFMTYANKAGYYFGIDNMANTGDYRLMVYGGVIIKAARIAVDTYVDQLESEVDVDDNGDIDDVDVTHLQDMITQQINVNMADQISGVTVVIQLGQDIIDTSKLNISLGIRPKGYTSYIYLNLGLQAPVAST